MVKNMSMGFEVVKDDGRQDAEYGWHFGGSSGVRLLVPREVIKKMEDELMERVRAADVEGYDNDDAARRFADEANKAFAAKEQKEKELSPREKREAEIAERALMAAKRPCAKKREVFVFGPDATAKMRKSLELREKNSSDHALAIGGLKSAIENNGIRCVPRIDAGKVLSGLADEFPNFSGVIGDLRIELEIAAAVKYSDFRVRPILLDGAPGIGKTRFAQTIADRIGVPLINLPSSVLQTGSDIAGSAPMWSTTQQGRIFRGLAESKSAVAVVLLDELDKVGSGDDRYPVLPALLQLLEQETARRFADASAEVEFNASKLIIIGTSNYLEKVDPALRSRMSIHKIKEPDAVQRMAVMHHAVSELAKSAKKGKGVRLDEDAAQKLADDDQHDLRALIAAVRRGFGKSLVERQSVVTPVLQDGAGAEQKQHRGIGFSAKF